MNGKTVVICLNPFISHFMPTIPLAKRLCETGNEVIYLGFRQMEAVVRQEGFVFEAIDCCENQDLTDALKQKEYDKVEILYKSIHEEVEGYLREHIVDLALIGISRFLLYLLPFFTANVNVMLYSLCAGEPSFTAKSPPITTDYIPSNHFISRVKCVLLWSRRLLRKGIDHKVIVQKRYYPWTAFFKICRQKRIRWKFGVDGFFPDLPILIFGTQYLEFTVRPDLIYTGLCNYISEVSTAYGDVIEFPVKGNPLVYCCLGTMSNRYCNAENFCKAVIALFSQNPQWNLLLSLGNRESDCSTMRSTTSNIHIESYVAQTLVLQHADVVLTHGGHGTVKECISAGVPMIVFSCSYDQYGDAARVHYHQIGIKSKLLKKTLLQKIFGRGEKRILPQKIKPLIEYVLKESVYRKKIQRMQREVCEQNELERAVKIIEQCINTTGCYKRIEDKNGVNV